VAGDDTGIGINQDWRVKAELADACGDLRDLSVTVRARIAGVGDQLVDRPQFNEITLST
jgi:hypothetical protein